jgi:bifunctional DNA-binding transcriptional regulator/antitoxin component of YhaV-PrlF toxin-antitoxin module
MPISTVTDKGQTTVPLEVRQALKVLPRQRLEWTVREDGTAVVHPQRSALTLFASLKSSKRFPGRSVERKAAMDAAALHAAREGTDNCS